MSPDVARFLLDLLNAQQLSVGADDFDEVVGKVIRARAELQQATTEGETDQP